MVSLLPKEKGILPSKYRIKWEGVSEECYSLDMHMTKSLIDFSGVREPVARKSGFRRCHVDK